jgi:hypothetical protein
MAHYRSNDSEPLIISNDAGKAKMSMVATGVRWPENVVLTGDAKAFREATVEYEQEWRERLRNSEEKDLGNLGGVVVGRLRYVC